MRDDAVRPLSKVFVYNYSHDDMNSHCLDSNDGKAQKINGEKHLPRIWQNVIKQNEKYADFKISVQYCQFKVQYPTLEISKEI